MRRAIALVLLFAPPAFAQCNPTWSALEGGGTDGSINALQVYGGSLYAAGSFAHAGGAPALNVARLNGNAWSLLGAGFPQEALALCTLALGGQQLLTVAGFPIFQGSSIKFWDGRAWTQPALGAPTTGWVGAIGSFDAGQDPELYASGGWGNYIARWSPPLGWREVGPGLATVVWSFLTYDDGRGPALFATGDLFVNNTPGTQGIARWDGQSWSDLGGGLRLFGEGRAMTVFDDGSGPALYVGGAFQQAGTVTTNHIAKWNGHAWSALGSGMTGPLNTTRVRALAVFDDGSGPALYAAGLFTAAGGAPALNIARWRGGVWSSVGSGLNDEVYALAVYDPDGPGPAPAGLYAAGAFTIAGGSPAPHIAVWHACPAVCYANCDGSTATPVLNVNDFLCFLNRYGASDIDANCDGSTVAPVLNVSDFICFSNRFAAGCP